MPCISSFLPLRLVGPPRKLGSSTRCICLVLIIIAIPLHGRTIYGQTPSVPVSETSVEAGETFSVKFSISSHTRLTYQLGASASYRLRGTETAPFRQPDPAPSSFSCFGSVAASAQEVMIIQCQTVRQNVPGVYRAFGPIVLQAQQGVPLPSGQSAPQGRQEYPSLRLPIVTVIPADPLPVPPPVVFPELGDGQLQLDVQQAFFDGAVRMGPIVDLLQKHPELGKRNSRINRQALASQLLATATVLEITRKRYVDADSAANIMKIKTEVPPLFEDFRLRLQGIAKLLATPLPQKAMLYDRAAHLQLTQLPSTSTSINVIPEGESLSRPYEDLLVIATDMSYGFSAIAKTGKTKFTWTLLTEPPGADIYLSNLSHSEFKWEGPTDQKEKTLDLARWTFRVSWSGCFKTETPNPFIQNPLTISLTKSGCKN